MSRRTTTFLALAALVLGLILFGRLFPEHDPARPRPITDEEKSLLVTLKDVKPLIPATHDTDAAVEEFRREPERGGGVELVYEFGAKSGDVTINTVATFSGSEALAGRRFTDTLAEIDELLEQYQFSTSPCASVGWGSEESCRDVHRRDGAIVGRIYVARKSDRVYQLQLWGVPFANDAAFAEIARVKLDRFARAELPR